VLSRFFRRRFLEMLEHAFKSGELHFFSALADLQNRDAFQRHLDPVRKKEWVVYAKPPPLERLRRRRPTEDHDADSRRIYPPLSAARLARRNAADPLLRVAR
jgi:hypothetical protein